MLGDAATSATTDSTALSWTIHPFMEKRAYIQQSAINNILEVQF